MPTNDVINVAFTRAVKYESRLKLALESDSGAGKTLTALILASRIAKYRGGRIALADSEHKTALLYADLIDFDHYAMPDHRIETYMAVMNAAEKTHSVLILDSTSHIWNGKGGALQEVDENAERNRTSRGNKNSYGAWSITRPKLNQFVDRINEIDIDLICTFRQKKRTQQVTQPDGSSKIETIKDVEMIAPNDIEYEFTILADLIKSSNELVITKTRCPKLKNQVFHALKSVEPINLDAEPETATQGMIDIVMDWLKGTPLPKQAPTAPAATGATRAYLEMHDRFRKVGAEVLWDDLMEKYGLSWHYAGKQMEDPAIAERGREVFKILKALVAAKELDQKLMGPDPAPEAAATQQSDTPAVQQPESSPVAEKKPDPEPAPAPPIEPAQPEPQPTPNVVTLPRVLGINDFQKQEIDGFFKAAKAARPKGYNRAAFLDELQTFRGAREDFIAHIMTSSIDAVTGGQA